MINYETETITKDSAQGQFTLLCDYADIIVNKKTVVEVEGEYHIYRVIPPFPTFEEYSKGDEFEEGDLLAVKNTWEDAHKVQLSP